jgi:NAD(P)-dependent dehydrogenase (short-subunit alcohol dehydrogenase family)
LTKPPSILITGCSSGIGRATAGYLKDRGYRVFAAARQESDRLALIEQGFESVLIDLTDSLSIQTGLETVLKATGGHLDALFNNAAYGQTGAVEDLSLDALRIQFETNVFGTHELTRQVIPVMRRQGRGRIIQNSSVLGFVAMPYRGAYNASKFALEGLTDTLRLELRGSGIDVVLIEPGPIESRFRETALRQFHAHVDRDASWHQKAYQRTEEEMGRLDKPVPFSLPPEAVAKAVFSALKARRPKARYRVTFPTHLFAVLKRILPDRALDWILSRVV